MSKSIKNVTESSRSKRPSNTRLKAAKKSKIEPTTPHKSKHDLILNLLRRKQGASLAEMQTASGWQPHSVRGFMSGTVKKRLGLKLQSSKSKDGERRYAIAS